MTATNRIWAKELLRFVNASPSPYHAVHELKSRLLKEGFEELREAQQWTLQRGKRYFVSRQGSALLAFVVPRDISPSMGGIVEAAHVDSPCLRVRPVSNRPASDGFVQVGVETYGGGLWHTWFDRDLALAGRIITGSHNALTEHLVNSDQPIMRIPTLAIHLDRTVSTEGFKFNPETHLLPILASDLLNSQYQNNTNKSHNEGMISALLKEKAKDQNVLAVDLCLYDAQPAAFGGLHDEFIFGARMDNLCMSFCVLQGLLESIKNESAQLRMAAWFDHEEVGSCSSVGAEGGLFESVSQRIATCLSLDYTSLMSRSLIISADMAHAAHPNYPEKHERMMRPQLHRGTVIKYNAQQRYATSVHSAALVKSIAAKHDIPIQEFEVRNDSPCGSTIGPMLGASSGALCVDLGLPQLSMHSIREMVSVDDVDHGVDLLSALYSDYRPLWRYGKIENNL